ncbi:MAG: VTT domain-containing protein [Acidobacteriota bacterium]
MSAEEGSAGSRGWFKFIVLLAFGGAAIAAVRWGPLAEFFDFDTLLAQIERLRANPFAPFVFLAVFTVGSALAAPSTVFLVIGGVVFGAWFGALLNFTGLLLGASLSYVVAKGLGYELISSLFGDRHEKLGRMLGRKGFWTLVRFRYLPIPYPVANSVLALAGVRYPLFLLTTAVAFAPAAPIWSYFAASLVGSEKIDPATRVRDFLLAGFLLFCLSFIPPRIIAFQRGRKYRRILEARRSRR